MRLVPNLDDAFYPMLVNFANGVGVPAEWFLNFLYLESRFDPTAFNGRYAGLNQMDMYELPKYGTNLDDYRAWTASQQLQGVVIPFFKAQLKYLSKPPRSPGVLYALNLYPLSLKTRGDAPDSVIIGRDSSNPKEVQAYYANANKGMPDSRGHCGLDFDCDGEITVQNLDEKLAELTHSNEYRVALAKLYAAGATPWQGLPAVANTFTTGQKIVGYGLASLFFATVATLGVTAYLHHTPPSRRRFATENSLETIQWAPSAGGTGWHGVGQRGHYLLRRAPHGWNVYLPGHEGKAPVPAPSLEDAERVAEHFDHGITMRTRRAVNELNID
jgi:hypothetical protein